MEYIIAKNHTQFNSLGNYNFCDLEDMILPDTISIDSETTGLAARHHDIFCIQIGTGENDYLIKMYDDEYTFYDLIPYLKDKILIFHNSLFDLGFFYKYNFFPKEVRDTMLASKILYNGDVENVRNDFGAVMERELGIKYDKTEQKNIAQVKLTTTTSIAYCFQDIHRLSELHSTLEEKIIEGGFEETYKLHCKYIRALAYMEQCGLPISSEKWKAKMEEDIKNVTIWQNNVEQYIYKHIPEFRDNQLDFFDTIQRIRINISSSQQMIKVFEKFKIPTKDKEGKDSINENIISKSKHEFVEMWLNFQEANHRVSTFGDKIYQQIENERIYTNFNPAVDTSRLSTRRGYINFLNFPSDSNTRDCFVANNGNLMGVCDYSGQETVVAADLSGDEAMTNSVVHGSDLHCAFARILFPELKDLSDDEIKELHHEERQKSKAPRFAFQYGGSAFTIHLNEGIPLEEAYKIEKGFKELHSGLYGWGNRVYEESISQGYIESADGWKLKLPEYKKFLSLKEKVSDISRMQWQMYKQGKIEHNLLKKDEKYQVKIWQNVYFYREKKKIVSDFFKLKSEYQRLCLNNPVQSRSAHQLKRATLLLFDWILKNNFTWKVKLCNTVHDEIVIEFPIKLQSIALQALEKCMLEGGNYYLTNLKIKADAQAGNSWGEAKH